jgi:hypothetical protein
VSIGKIYVDRAYADKLLNHGIVESKTLLAQHPIVTIDLGM